MYCNLEEKLVQIIFCTRKHFSTRMRTTNVWSGEPHLIFSINPFRLVWLLFHSKTMETFSSLSSIPPIIGSSTNSLSNNNETCLMRSTVKPSLNLNYPIIINPNKFKSVKFRKLKMRVEAVDEVSTVILEPAQVQVTWQIIVGTLGILCSTFLF